MRDGFGVIGKPSDKWYNDQSVFFNRRSEMGFSGDKGASIVAGMFGRELFDLIYPQWWGGQGKVSQPAPTEKVNNKMYEAGSNFAHLMTHPGMNTAKIPEVASTSNYQSGQEQPVACVRQRPVTSALLNKERLDPVSMRVAGIPTEGCYYRNVSRAFDPSTFYGLEGTINGGGEPVYPLYKDPEFTPPPHIPQARDPTLRSLYPKRSKQ